jgi:hypothetical protein
MTPKSPPFKVRVFLPELSSSQREQTFRLAHAQDGIDAICQVLKAIPPGTDNPRRQVFIIAEPLDDGGFVPR